MIFTINRDLLLQNLTSVSKALSTKAQMPVLTGIKIDVVDNKILLTASNSEISIQACIDDKKHVKIEEEGTFIAPGKYLIELVKKTEAKEIYFESFEDNAIKILADKSNFTLNVLSKDDYPIISFADSPTFLTLDAINLKQLIRKTTFAVSLSESRVILTGVSVTSQGNLLEVVSTDSYRLAKKQLKFNVDYPEIKVVIPGKSLDELNKIVDEGETLVEIHISHTKALFKYKNLLYQTRLIDGTFPNTNSLIPTEFLTSIKFNKNELISAIERAAVFTNMDSSNIIKLTLNSDKTVEIASTTNEIGAAQEELNPIECSNVVPFQIAFSSKYFLEAIKSFDSTEVTVHFTGEVRPFIITGEYDRNLIQLILPVRVS
ncbi:MAG TPA: DNA polymerase III subunit beta [Bacilli bacterium]|jgi:DNA polymerase-3 subunit beta|nr:DNA polymerase III subunit beta [Acholeplasmataceae bacterium]HNZ77985.1 DNA polymerase III subunit beta [Bacilli bacterium]HOD61036.1 DNA polymerase III subunit beta [Bacilli bacterium]HOH60893.1 DNA polymerase III subunit beta [Bacilli bacterium]HPB48769.1 DNA polymerase III subunit beta [Bacilli bacterium]